MKYRIKQINKKFYPQELVWRCFWVGFNQYSYGKYGKICFPTLNEAEQFLDEIILQRNPLLKVITYL